MRYRPKTPYAAPPFALVHRPEDASVCTLPLHGYRQARNYCCGFASALMVLRHFERPLAGQALFEALGTGRDGTGQTAIVQVLRSQGIRANLRYDADFTRVVRAIDRGKLLIGYLHDEEHWLVLYGYGRGPDRVFVADPEPDPKKVCEQPWESYGSRLGGFALVCSPDPKWSDDHVVGNAEGTRVDEVASEPVAQLGLPFEMGESF